MRSGCRNSTDLGAYVKRDFNFSASSATLEDIGQHSRFGFVSVGDRTIHSSEYLRAKRAQRLQFLGAATRLISVIYIYLRKLNVIIIMPCSRRPELVRRRHCAVVDRSMPRGRLCAKDDVK